VQLDSHLQERAENPLLAVAFRNSLFQERVACPLLEMHFQVRVEASPVPENIVPANFFCQIYKMQFSKLLTPSIF
jgi:hypothetical protein